MDKQGFTAYLESRGLRARTIITHLKYVGQFFDRVQKEDVQVTKPDVLKFLEYLKNDRQLQNNCRSYYLASLNHYFTWLRREGLIAVNPCMLLRIRGTHKRKLYYKIYTREELDQLFDNYYQSFIRSYDDSHYVNEAQRQYSALGRERNIVMLSILFCQGTATSEIATIELGDLDLIKATLKIRGAKRANDRTLPLQATQVGLFMHYLQNIRPQILKYQTSESNRLFLPLPETSKKETDGGGMLRYSFGLLTKQMKSIDKQFLNVLQLRASVISYWIKTQGLRKAQYLAGHRYVSSTENFLPNNLDDLTDYINKLHPFNLE